MKKYKVENDKKKPDRKVVRETDVGITERKTMSMGMKLCGSFFVFPWKQAIDRQTGRQTVRKTES